VYFLRITLSAGVMASVAAFVWALIYFHRLARQVLDEGGATGAVVLLAAYPFAAFFSTASPESLFLLTSLGALYHMRCGEWAKAGLWGLLAGLTRPTGCLLSVPLALMAIATITPRMAWLGRGRLGVTREFSMTLKETPEPFFPRRCR
jgi:Gpi18-like mannosyltransferase